MRWKCATGVGLGSIRWVKFDSPDKQCWKAGQLKKPRSGIKNQVVETDQVVVGDVPEVVIVLVVAIMTGKVVIETEDESKGRLQVALSY